MLISFFCILYFSVSSLAATPIPENTTWAILAWGFDGGGKDNTNGVRLVDLDIDTQKGA